jgi:AhpD family alkylhydroperoxidase
MTTTQTQLSGEQRITWARVNPEAFKAMLALEEIGGVSLDQTLRELIKLRASGLNGCAYCLDMHAHDAAKNGETLQRIVAVAAWHEAKHLFTAREQAALALTDAVTKIGEHGVTDEVWDEAAARFDEKELVEVLVSISTINMWNRLGIAARAHTKARA